LLKFRHGLSPGAKNISNVRHTQEPVVDKQKIGEIEVIMKDLIESGFGTHCEEELLTFDDLGNLVSVQKGI
jgi:hypothetical protein